MKMKKMAGALALSAALAMGTAMPAFAASATTETDFAGTDGSTEIKASVLDTQLQATVPLHVAIVFNADTGEGDILAPDKSTYAITNTGEGAIVLKEAVIEDGATGLKLAGWYVSGKKTLSGVGGDEVLNSAFTDNLVMLTYDDGTNVTYLAPDHALTAASTSADEYDNEYLGYAELTATDFQEVNIAKGASLPIQLGGITKFATAVDNTQLSDTLCTIKYTIAKA